MINNLQKGDEVITAGGILGKVSKLEADTGMLLIEIAPDVKVKIKKETISQIMVSEKKDTTAEKEASTSKKILRKKGKIRRENAKN